MPDYEKMYFALAAKVADIIELLIKVQQECEEEYISARLRPARMAAVRLLPPKDGAEK
ncbi:MAG: hypothetical protein FWD39_00025 [Clostridiales bacterium]|nr:hypothetical protein [Clostridiales bacterium]